MPPIYRQSSFLGMELSLGGFIFAILAYFIANSVPFTALAISIAIIGFTILSLPEKLSGSDAMKSLLRGSILPLEPLLEDIVAARDGINAKLGVHNEETLNPNRLSVGDFSNKEFGAVYLPPDAILGENGMEPRLSVYLPLRNDRSVTVDGMIKAPTRLLLDDSQSGIRIFTPGAFICLVPEIQGRDVSVEDALQFVLVRSTELCSSVRASEVEETIIVEINNAKGSAEPDAYRKLLGSFPVSLAANVIAAVRRNPVIVENEEVTPRRTIARLVVKK